MDTYRGQFSEHASNGEANSGDDWPEVEFGADADADEGPAEPPPSPVGQDERRMQVRAYNHWASLLDDRNFPSIEDLDPEALPDFGPHSVLLDFTAGIENPTIQYLGGTLALECGTDAEIHTLADVPARSLLSRITDHYMQILANQAPIGFEAEFVNQRDKTILYRGILLPFSSDDDTIDFIYGVINWKELADQQTTDSLLSEIDQALEIPAPSKVQSDLPMTDWADGPGEVHDEELAADFVDVGEGVLDLADLSEVLEADDQLPEPAFGGVDLDDTLELGEALELGRADELDDDDTFDLTVEAGPDLDSDMGLADWLGNSHFKP